VSDWPLVAKLAARHRVSPWILAAISRAAIAEVIPEDVLESLRSDSWTFSVITLSLSQGLDEVLTALSEAEIPVVVLKGAVVAETLYPDPSYRPYTDIDLLVPVERNVDVNATCLALGYELEENHGGLEAARHDTSEHAYESLYVHPKQGIRIDVHYDHLQIGLRPAELGGLWQRRQPWQHRSASASALAPCDLFITLAVHLHRHGFDRLIWFKDLDLFIRKYGEKLDWRWVEKTAVSEGISASLQQSLFRLSHILETPLPAPARRLAKRTHSTFIGSLLWPEEDLFRLRTRPERWRRAVQFVPWDGLRGALPSMLIMGRRVEKARALWRRLRGKPRLDRDARVPRR
jgi:hypothetical protein